MGYKLRKDTQLDFMIIFKHPDQESKKSKVREMDGTITTFKEPYPMQDV